MVGRNANAFIVSGTPDEIGVMGQVACVSTQGVRSAGDTVRHSSPRQSIARAQPTM